MHDFTELFGETPEQITISCDHPASLTVCYMGRGLSGTIEEARMNAKLISRSPEMLYILRELTNHHHSSFENEELYQKAQAIVDDLKDFTYG